MCLQGEKLNMENMITEINALTIGNCIIVELCAEGQPLEVYRNATEDDIAQQIAKPIAIISPDAEGIAIAVLLASVLSDHFPDGEITLDAVKAKRV